MKIAFVHEYLNQFGGAERMLQVLCALYPRAPIYTLLYDRDATGGVFDGRVIKTPNTRHICYCLTPPRFLWDNSHKFVEEFGYPKLIKKLLPPFITYLRIWDKEASLRVDEFWSISDFVQGRIKKYYSKNSEVIYPPVNLSKFKIGNWKLEVGNYFLMVGRLVSYKRFDLAVRAFSENGLCLKIVGIGPELNKLRSLAYGNPLSKASGNIEFLGLVSDEKLANLYSQAQACVFPQEEDFGIVPLESMASGRPVIAFKAGGVAETVAENETGIFFNEQNPESLQAAIEKFHDLDFKPEDCRKQAEKFDVGIFRDKFSKLIGEAETGSKKI